MNQRVKLGVRQISTNEIVNLGGIMEMTFTNYGCDMNLNIGGVTIPLRNGKQMSLPSGSGRVYTNSQIELEKTEPDIITKTLYSHPEINDGEFTFNRESLYTSEYLNNRDVINGHPALISPLRTQRANILSANYIVQFYGINGSNQYPFKVWVDPSSFGLTSNFNLYKRWEHYRRGYAEDTDKITNMSMEQYVQWAINWFRVLDYRKLAFLKNELENESASYQTIRKELVANNELNAFDTLIGNNISKIINKALSIEANLSQLDGQIAQLQNELNDAIAFNTAWDGQITIISREYVIVYDENGQTQEVEYDPNAESLPINVTIIYSIEDNG